MHVEVDGVWGKEVLPGVVRSLLMSEFDDGFFPVKPSSSAHDYKVRSRDACMHAGMQVT